MLPNEVLKAVRQAADKCELKLHRLPSHGGLLLVPIIVNELGKRE
jgi:hypothetical protein